MPSHRRISNSNSPADILPLTRLLLLRMLVPLGAHRKFMDNSSLNDEAVAEAIGLGDWVDTLARDFDAKLVRAELHRLYDDAERKCANAAPPRYLSTNVRLLAELVGLSDTDCRVLEFAVMLQIEPLLLCAAAFLGEMPSAKLPHTLSVLLAEPERQVRLSLQSGGVLSRSGLMAYRGDRSALAGLDDRLELLSARFADRLYSPDADPLSLLRDVVVPASPARLSIADYDHVAESLDVLRPYLKQSLATRRKGVNVFLHGKPGTGKSELAKALAQELGCQLFEVASEDEEGDSVEGPRRLRAFRAAQCFFARQPALLVFDEAEDVFADGDILFGRKSTAQTRKAWINRTLEDNPVPTLWLSNSVGHMDPAFIRRFDMVFELPVPPKKQRERIVAEVCGDLLDARAVARIAECEALAPAVVARAASVVRLIRNEVDQPADAVECLVCNTLEAQGHRPIPRHDPNRLPDMYDPAFIHADCDLAQVAEGCVTAKAGRLCLFGPPGTGKTAYARWLAQQMDVPLVAKRASDLLSKWVGGTEERIARAFKQAEQAGALLLIDEVDSFLQDRRGAHANWEVSAVNEMLTQMESFAGAFVASTNLMTGLDQASLRRFDLKVKFDFLKPEQRVEMMRRQCMALGLGRPDSADLARIQRLNNLTPGDFSAVVRQGRFRPILTTPALIAALEAECALKENSGTMGFLG